MTRDREACGRCSMSVTVEAVNADRDPEERADRDPYGDERIEVDERQLRLLSPTGWIAVVSNWIDDVGRRVTWGR